MKNLFLLVLLFSGSLLFSQQPVINNNDMPVANDIFYYNQASPVAGADYTATGNNYTWDFSDLIPSSQASDTFVSIYSTSLLYLISFYDATVALGQGSYNMGFVSLSDIYNFYKNSSSEFSMLGYGAKINGVPMSLKYDNPDVLYSFPLNTGNIDSSESYADVSITGLGYYGQSKKRINYVDGWGTLYLPSDTFQVLRIKSDVYSYDTLYYDTLSFGYGMNNHQTEYKWLAEGYVKPVLEVVKSGFTVDINYIGDPNSSVRENENYSFDFEVFPNPVTANKLNLKIHNKESADVRFTIFSLTGESIYECNFSYNHSNNEAKEILLSGIAPGLYVVSVDISGQKFYKKLLIK